jgi:hypothetical protein
MLQWLSSIFGIVPFAACRAKTPVKAPGRIKSPPSSSLQDGAIALERTGRGGLVDELELETNALALGL